LGGGGSPSTLPQQKNENNQTGGYRGHADQMEWLNALETLKTGT
jgi:hypothetical protein